MSSETRNDIATEAARLLKGITPGEWRAATTPHPEAVRLKTEAVSVHGPDCLIYVMGRDYGCLPDTFERQKRDAKFIAAASRLVRGLLTERAERADAAVAALKLALESQISDVLFRSPSDITVRLSQRPEAPSEGEP